MGSLVGGTGTVALNDSMPKSKGVRCRHPQLHKKRAHRREQTKRAAWQEPGSQHLFKQGYPLKEVIGSRHAGWLDWERVVDFSHGSFRLMGSHKPKHIQRVSESMGKMMESIPLSGRHRRAAATGN
eukprot:1157625-Pelagomonas_calceolata.AAC.10